MCSYNNDNQHELEDDHVDPVEQQPVFVVNDYSNVDGYHAQASQCKLSLGKPTNPNNFDYGLALQVWDSEELEVEEGVFEECEALQYEVPVHQVLDQAIVLVAALKQLKQSYRYPDHNLPETRVGLQGSALTLSLNKEHPELAQDLEEINLKLGKLGELTGERLRVLRHLLDELDQA